MESASIVIIGAGAAGIAAATRLLQFGFLNVLVLEAENRYGGRIHTIPFADNVVDLGAQWCHGEKGNVVYELTRDLDMLASAHDQLGGYSFVRSNREVINGTLTAKFKTIVSNIESKIYEELEDYEGSLGTYLTESFWSDLGPLGKEDKTVAREFFENYKKMQCSMDGSDHLFEVSGKGQLEYWDCEGDHNLNWKDKGYRSFLQLLMKADSNDTTDLGVLRKHTRYNSHVENIKWQTQEGNVRIRLWNGELIEADHVICTASLGVLKETHPKLFTPPLPNAKCRAIDGLKLGTVDKFFLEFKEPFAPANGTGFSLLWREEDLLALRNSEYFWLEGLFGFYCVSYQPRLLEGWIIGAYARHMETLTEAEVIKAVLWLFRKFFTNEAPTPVRFLRTRWHSNPNFRGSYSFRTMYAEELRIGSADLATPLLDAKDDRPLLQFAGEATSTHHYSTVHGAVESGWREAQRLRDFYQAHKAPL
ncbi:peroxisomal N(1)-acetyl-spermine/spermidine oxidase [Ceratitis capitata]|uniref:(Mediterranean fruit fly) hypothetical protein n=2 Tax=Ceratitis capitata TaxID=7213 RepID=A0A811V1I0_CERCA|nr:peroxisomal N(1)-acetyl-spermine/spermidine oxidase [Ceratitis capitata]CAD7004408.1 unnamed protein product [Ceratitis capitata]